MEECLIETSIDNIFFDIDLYFFVLDNPFSTGGDSTAKRFSYLSDKNIRSMLDINRPLMQWIFKRLCGFTIAIEPEHTGGLMKAIKYLKMLDNLYFKPSLLTNCGSNWKKNSNWKHLN